MKGLRISTSSTLDGPLTLPVEAVTSTFGILAVRGARSSNDWG